MLYKYAPKFKTYATKYALCKITEFLLNNGAEINAQCRVYGISSLSSDSELRSPSCRHFLFIVPHGYP